MKEVIFIINRDFNDGDNFTGDDVDLIVANINANETSINGLTTNKVDKVSGKSLVADTEITKLSGIETGANKYIHPTTHSPSIIAQDSNNRLVSDIEKTSWSNKIDNSKIGVINGVAQLDSNGLVPSSQLPSYVDDVIEGTYSTFPTTGESGKIYLDTTTNLTYRWSGTVYVEISPSIALGETSSTAYSGDKGKATTDSLNLHKADSVVHITSAERTTWNGKQNAIVNPTIQTATLQNSWVDNGTGIATTKYYKTIENIVHLKGLIRSGTTTNPTILFNLAEGFRPPQMLVIYAVAGNGTLLVPAQLNIGAEGNVYLTTNNGYNTTLSLEGINFPTF